ncbi:hypothetical protein N7532_005271 [Penicillium argentinense]|uniref:AA1-like domain-containing protein n=1 Tax=Penicillium argentinense TaxID=1131581 RepID=A0A9W9FDK9_9EURO|nr:uncharacterized protein N7532_005271 [Penicillium argentinense]KAJ5098270.1 hypothetical protein N7532_005271 [Penicillium argentinense]
MNLTITSILLAASLAIAAPSTTKRESHSLQITDFNASGSKGGAGASMHFVVTDANYPDDTPTDCNLLWIYGESPNGRARCNNGKYKINFPDGVKDLHKFTLELVRQPEPIGERGQVVLDSSVGGPGVGWSCVDNPNETVLVRCNYAGTLEFPVSWP